MNNLSDDVSIVDLGTLHTRDAGVGRAERRGVRAPPAGSCGFPNGSAVGSPDLKTRRSADRIAIPGRMPRPSPQPDGSEVIVDGFQSSPVRPPCPPRKPARFAAAAEPAADTPTPKTGLML